MKKQILAVTAAAILVAAFAAVALQQDADARHRGSTSGSNIAGRILSNLQMITSDLSIIDNDASFIREDLKIKKRFYSVHSEDGYLVGSTSLTGAIQVTGNNQTHEILLVDNGICFETLSNPALLDGQGPFAPENDGSDPCAFNVESLIVETEGDCFIDNVVVDGLASPIDPLATTDDANNPRDVNVFLESDIPVVGASDEVGFTIQCANLADVFVWWTGEQPQAMVFDVEVLAPFTEG